MLIRRPPRSKTRRRGRDRTPLPLSRSEIMSRIRGKNTSLDRVMKSLLRRNGFRFRSYPTMPGHPDFIVDGGVVIFCDSSFWHGRNWPKLRKKLAKGKNADYWVKHIDTNRNRDASITKLLSATGYKVLRFWDTELKESPEACLEEIRKAAVSCNALRVGGRRSLGSPQNCRAKRHQASLPPRSSYH